MLPDYHVHTRYSPDSAMEPEEVIRAAISAGISDICFTEHMDLGHHMETFNRVPDFSEIDKTIAELRIKYNDIHIGKGIEVGYILDTTKQTAEVLANQSFDYVLLSTHCVDGIDCYLPESKRGRDKMTAYKRYLETLYESVVDRNLLEYYDCISHIGYIAKCNHYEDNTFSYELFSELFDKILHKIIDRGKGIEVNTSGINRAGHVLPHPSIIRRYKELGGKIITIGSDAHKAENVGSNIAEAVGILKKAGFDEFTIFRNRVPHFVKLENVVC